MAHEQEPLAWVFYVGMYLYAMIFAWIFKFADTAVVKESSSEEYTLSMFSSYGFMTEWFFKFALAVFWMVKLGYTWDYRNNSLTSGTNAVTKVTYWAIMETACLITLLGYGVVKFRQSYSGFSGEKDLKRTVNLKRAALALTCMWIGFYSIWQICYISGVQFTDLATNDAATKVAITAYVFATLSFIVNLVAVGTDGVNIVDSTDKRVTTVAELCAARPAIGTTPGRLIEFPNSWVFICIFNLLGMYSWTVIFNDYGRQLVAIMIQQFAVVYTMHWSGDWKSWMELFVLATFVMAQMYSMVPGFLRYGIISTALPAGEYMHLQFFQYDQSTMLLYPTNLLYTFQLVLSVSALVLTAGVSVAAAISLNQMKKESEAASKVTAATTKVPALDKLKVGSATAGLANLRRASAGTSAAGLF